MVAEESVYGQLARQFPVGAHKKVKKGGREQTYVPWTDKVDRFNEVLGHDWSFRIVREGLTNTEAWVLGELSVTIDGVTTVRQQYGCEAIAKGQNETPTTDLFKIAGTDALSKAATLFGCGLYLSIQEERAEVEAAMREAQRPAPTPIRRETPKPEPTPKETVRAREMVPAPALPDAVRTEAIRRYRAIAKHALEDGHPDGDAINSVDPEGLSSKMLGEALSRLQAKFPKAWKTLEAANG